MTENNFLQDVVPPSQKRSIRDIPVPPRKKLSIRKPIIKSDEIKIVDTTNVKEKPRENFDELNGNNYKKSQNIKRYLKLASVLIFAIAIFVLFSNLDSAKVTIYPKIVEAVVTKNISIGDLSKSTDTYTLGYRVITLDKEVSKIVESDSEEFVQSKASGTITIFNEYSDKTQNLIKNTRFESPQGLIYTIKNNAAVPGFKTVNGEKVAGTLDVEVVASVAGENYNVDSAEFTIPGFKGQEPYDFFYAKTKTAISGGFDGVKKLVSQAKIDAASIELRQNAKDALIADLKSQVSSEFVFLFDENSFVFGQINESQEDNSNSVALKLKGTVNAKVFNKIDLSNALATDGVFDYSDGENVLAKDIENIKLLISGNELVADGPMTFVWQNDTESLKQLFVNKKKSEFGALIKSLSGVEKANLVIKPFWRTRFPEATKDVNIEVVSN
jgi:hypothetical protein